MPVELVEMLPPLSGSQLADTASGGAPSVWRRQVLAVLATRALGNAPAAIRLGIDIGGRRFLTGTSVFASVACRSGTIAAVISRTPVGIDIEAIDEAAAAGPVALEDFDGDTRAWHGSAGVWAAKEAALKACGEDLASLGGRWRFGDGTIARGTGAPMRVAHAVFGGFVAAIVLA